MADRYKQPVSVLVVIHAPPDQVLLLRRRVPPDFWQSVTGSLEPGETPVQAAVRELHEETGLGIETSRLRETGVVNRFPILPAWRSRYAPDVRFNTEHVFSLALDRPQAIRTHPEEHTEYRWMHWQEAAERASSYTNQDAIRALFADG